MLPFLNDCIVFKWLTARRRKEQKLIYLASYRISSSSLLLDRWCLLLQIIDQRQFANGYSESYDYIYFTFYLRALWRLYATLKTKKTLIWWRVTKCYICRCLCFYLPGLFWVTFGGLEIQAVMTFHMGTTWL